MKISKRNKLFLTFYKSLHDFKKIFHPLRLNVNTKNNQFSFQV